MAKFKINKTYSCRSVCDHNCVWDFTVVSRTAKTITIVGSDKKPSIKRVSMYYDGITETVFPLGSYSMAPILKAA